MANKIFIIGVFVFALLLVHNIILCQSFPLNEEFPEIILEGTEVRTLHSDYVGQDFELFISLPRSYKATDTTYPVVFILDSYRAFTIVKGLMDALSWPNPIIPEVVPLELDMVATGTKQR